MSLSSIVDVQISADTKTPSREGFGTPMIAGFHSNWPQRIRLYAEPADMLLPAEGFATTDPLYKMAVALFSQTPRPANFKVGRLANAYSQTIKLTPDGTAGGGLLEGRVNTIDIDGVAASYTNGPGETVATVCDGLKIAIDALSLAITVTDNATDLDVDADNAGDLFQFGNVGPYLTFEDLTPDPGIAADLTAIDAEDGDWYGFSLDLTSTPIALAAATWTETETKIFGASTMDTAAGDPGSTTDLMYLLNSVGRGRTFPVYHDDADEYAAVAWLGRCLPTDPGSITWAFKSLSGAQFDNLSAAQTAAMDTKKGNYYTRIAGVDITQNGTMADGEYIDNVRGIDWLTARLKEDIFRLLITNDKLAFTDVSVEAVKGTIRSRLSNAKDVGFLDPAYESQITAPLVLDVDPADRANRCLPDIEFQDRLAGAIHKVIIRGRLIV